MACQYIQLYFSLMKQLKNTTLAVVLTCFCVKLCDSAERRTARGFNKFRGRGCPFWLHGSFGDLQGQPIQATQRVMTAFVTEIHSRMYVYMYVRMYVCMHACMYVCTYVRMHVRTYVCMDACMHVLM